MSVKNFWATTWGMLRWCTDSVRLSFKCDVAAEPLTAKCREYYSSPALFDLLLHPKAYLIYKTNSSFEEFGRVCVGLDSLNINWPSDWWCNPEFDSKRWVYIYGKITAGKRAPEVDATALWAPNWLVAQERRKSCIIYDWRSRYNFAVNVMR